MSRPVFEPDIKGHGYDGHRQGEDVPLRDLDQFSFYTKRKKGSRLVSIEDIEEGEPIYGKGKLLPKKSFAGRLAPIDVELDVLDSWALEFCSNTEESGIWIRTRRAWYRLLTPIPEYKYLFEDLRTSFEITLKIFAVLNMPGGPLMTFREMVVELHARYGITDKEVLDNAEFISRHLRSDAKFHGCAFIRSLGITLGLFERGKYVLGSVLNGKKKKKRISGDISIKKEKHKRSNHDIHAVQQAELDESEEEHSRSVKKRKLTHNVETAKKNNNIFVTKSRQYHDVKDRIPSRYLSEDQKSLKCFVCDITMRLNDFEEFLKHITKHRTNLVGELLDKDRIVLRLQSFINQTRVRNFIETSLADDSSSTNTDELKLNNLPSQVGLNVRKRKRHSFYVDRRPVHGQEFESEHQLGYDHVYREEDIENVVVDTTNYKRPPPGNHYGHISEGQEEIEEIEEDYEDDMDLESADDESTEYRPRSKKRVKQRARASARRFSSALQLEKERLAREQAKRSRAIDALQVLVAKEIFNASETVPAIELGCASNLKDIQVLLHASEVMVSRNRTDSHTADATPLASSYSTVPSRRVNNMNNDDGRGTNDALRSASGSGSGTLLEQASRELTAMTSNGNVHNIALCKSNDNIVMVKQ